jgi:hypothetical protein
MYMFAAALSTFNAVLVPNPDMISVGQKLRIPTLEDAMKMAGIVTDTEEAVGAGIAGSAGGVEGDNHHHLGDGGGVEGDNHLGDGSYRVDGGRSRGGGVEGDNHLGGGDGSYRVDGGRSRGGEGREVIGGELKGRPPTEGGGRGGSAAALKCNYIVNPSFEEAADAYGMKRAVGEANKVWDVCACVCARVCVCVCVYVCVCGHT